MESGGDEVPFLIMWSGIRAEESRSQLYNWREDFELSFMCDGKTLESF